MKHKKVKVLEIASSILENDKSLQLEVIDLQSKFKLEDYSQEDMMKLLMTKIKGICYNSERLADKVKKI